MPRMGFFFLSISIFPNIYRRAAYLFVIVLIELPLLIPHTRVSAPPSLSVAAIWINTQHNGLCFRIKCKNKISTIKKLSCLHFASTSYRLILFESSDGSFRFCATRIQSILSQRASEYSEIRFRSFFRSLFIRLSS